MEMMVIIPMESYRAMLEKCDSTRPEYTLLRNGVVTRNLDIVFVLIFIANTGPKEKAKLVLLGCCHKELI